MEYCPECENLMYPKEVEGKKKLVCRSCGYSEVAGDSKDYKLVKEGEKKEAPPVIENDQESLPKTKADCPECDNDKAFWWMQQTRGADEPTTRFFKCTKCNHVWREY